MRALEEVLLDAKDRRPKRLTHETAYDHSNINQWLKEALPKGWQIYLPSLAGCALSDWPLPNQVDEVRGWLKEQDYKNPDDLINGACEPLAFYLSNNINSIVGSGVLGTNANLGDLYRTTKEDLETLKPTAAATVVFWDFIKQEKSSPSFWGKEIVGSYDEYLCGHRRAKCNISAAAVSPAIKIMPLYVLSYIFDNNELTDEELEQTTEETAQYSLHVVGLVFDKVNRILFVADPNGGLNPGSNMEFLKVPLQQRIATPKKPASTTKVSQFDARPSQSKRSFVGLNQSRKKIIIMK